MKYLIVKQLSIDNHFLWDIWFQGLLSVYKKKQNNSHHFPKYFHIIKKAVFKYWTFFFIDLWWLSVKMYWNISSHWLSWRIKYVKKVFKKISNTTKFYCPNKSIYYFFRTNTKISTSFRRSMLISFWIDTPGTDPGGRTRRHIKLKKYYFFA